MTPTIWSPGRRSSGFGPRVASLNVSKAGDSRTASAEKGNEMTQVKKHRVELHYFNPDGGKWKYHGEYETEKQWPHEVWDELREMFSRGVRPGIVDGPLYYNVLVLTPTMEYPVMRVIYASEIDSKITITVQKSRTLEMERRIREIQRSPKIEPIVVSMPTDPAARAEISRLLETIRRISPAPILVEDTESLERAREVHACWKTRPDWTKADEPHTKYVADVASGDPATVEDAWKKFYGEEMPPLRNFAEFWDGGDTRVYLHHDRKRVVHVDADGRREIREVIS